MPKKAKSERPAVFEVVGGYNANAAQQQSQQNYQPQSQNNQQYLAAQQQAGFVQPVDMLTGVITLLNGNPYIIGAAYLMINLGGRYLSLELTKQQEAFLANKALRPILLFSVLFIATRSLVVAFWTTIIVLSIIWVFANENHVMCLIPGWRKENEPVLPNGMLVLGQMPTNPEKNTTVAASSDDKTYEEKMQIIKDKTV